MKAQSSTSAAVELGDEARLLLLVAHCRFVETQLPRGELGVATAAAVISAVPDAHRRGIPDLLGSAPEILDLLVGYGLLPALPSRRVVRAVPRLLAALTPIVEARSPRSWAIWLSHLADPRILAKIQRRTPARRSGGDPEPPPQLPVRRRRDALAEYPRVVAELTAVTDRCRAAEERLAAEERRSAELTRLVEDAGVVRDKILLEAARIQEERDRLAEESARQTEEIEGLRLSLQAAESRYRHLKISRGL